MVCSLGINTNKLLLIGSANTFGESEMENPIITMRNGKPVFLLDLSIALIVYNDGIVIEKPSFLM